jgi:hypothetical protein
MNQFVARLLNNFVNEVVIEGLARSRLFQRFAVATNATMKDVQKTSADKLKTTLGDLVGEKQATSIKSGPPLKPLTGFPGFVSAFIKEIRKDMGASR